MEWNLPVSHSPSVPVSFWSLKTDTYCKCFVHTFQIQPLFSNFKMCFTKSNCTEWNYPNPHLYGIFLKSKNRYLLSLLCSYVLDSVSVFKLQKCILRTAPLRMKLSKSPSEHEMALAKTLWCPPLVFLAWYRWKVRHLQLSLALSCAHRGVQGPDPGCGDPYVRDPRSAECFWWEWGGQWGRPLQPGFWRRSNGRNSRGVSSFFNSAPQTRPAFNSAWTSGSASC